MTFLKSSDLTVDKLQELIEGIPFDENGGGRVWIWAAAVDGWTFDFFLGLDETVNWYQSGGGPKSDSRTAREAVTHSLEGRLFAASGELRWRHVPALASPLRTVFLGETNWCPEFLEESAEINKLTRTSTASEQSGEYLLWGTRDEMEPSKWIELQIPHRLKYPVDDEGERVYLRTETWANERGEVQFIRFCDLTTK